MKQRDWREESFNDIAKQGFMKKQKVKPKTIYEVINEVDGLVYHGENKHSAEAALRKYGGKLKTLNPGILGDLKELAGFIKSKRELLTEDDARKLAEGFHGRESRGKIEIAQRQKYYSKLAIIGELEELGILCADGVRILPIRFKANKAIGISTEDNPDTIWVCAANTQQIQFVDGDQTLTFNAHVCRELELDDDELEKQYVNVGPVYSIVYFADKHHLEGPEYQKRGTSYEHKFGEDGGRLPSLFYDTLNDQILLVGGSYTITPEGIKN